MSRRTKLMVALVVAICTTTIILAAAQGQDRFNYLPVMRKDHTATLTYTPLYTYTPTRTATPTRTPTPTATPTLVPGVHIVDIYHPADIHYEYVTMKNTSGSRIDLTGWSLRDDNNNVYIFPQFSIKGGATFKLWTRVGYDTTTDLYWNRTEPVWNRINDCGYLRQKLDSGWKVVSQYCY